MNFSSRHGALRLGVIAAAAMSFAPLAHAGFFEQLFGGGTPAPAVPSYGYDQPTTTPAPLGEPIIRPRVRKRVIVHRDPTPQRQKVTDLMHDKTLRPGDAVVMRDGMHIYDGPDADRHSSKQFVPIADARHVSKSERAALVAIDTRRVLIAAGGHQPDTLASGRSASVTTPISKGFKITDARGASVRYVGP